MPCYITRTGSFLPGAAVENHQIHDHLGWLSDEADVQQRVLAMNGIVRRHYAQDKHQQPTHDVYDLAVQAAQACVADEATASPIGLLSAGTTYAPLSAPGIASIVHHRLQAAGLIDWPLEISSHAGICTSAAAALVNAVRSVNSGQHDTALCVAAEHASEILKAKVIKPIDDRAEHEDIRTSRWFMSVFLRFMLSDGAGAMLLQSVPRPQGLSWRVDWTHSMSFANEAPLCMHLDNADRLLSQNVAILSRYFIPLAGRFVQSALQRHDERLDDYQMLLPHMSSFFFRRKMERVIREHCQNPDTPVPYWTNLATAGNTGAASIFVMLDHYLAQAQHASGDRLLLFIPESGQFNFVMISLTAVHA
jgi:3-oxoacyl-[acyl-carrier-protein] synthase III